MYLCSIVQIWKGNIAFNQKVKISLQNVFVVLMQEYYYNDWEWWRVISVLICIISYSRTQSSNPSNCLNFHNPKPNSVPGSWTMPKAQWMWRFCFITTLFLRVFYTPSRLLILTRMLLKCVFHHSLKYINWKSGFGDKWIIGISHDRPYPVKWSWVITFIEMDVQTDVPSLYLVV